MMSNNLLDIGGGVKTINIAGAQSDGGGAGNTLSSLIKSQQEAVLAPLRAQKLKLDVQKTQQDLLNNEMKRVRDQADLYYKMQVENRKQRQDEFSIFKDFVQFAKDNPNAAPALLKQISPNSSMVFNDDGTATVTMPSVKRLEFGEDGKFQEVVSEEQVPIVINPNQLSQDKRIQVEQNYTSRFDSADVVKNYRNYYDGYKRILELAKEGTGAGDIGVVNVFARTIQGGTGVVTESDVANAMKTVGMSDQWANSIAKAWKAEAPLFGEFEYNKDGSVKNMGAARENFVNALGKILEANKQDVLSYGNDIVEAARRQGLDARNIIVPVGDITEEMFLETREDRRSTLLGGIGE